MAGSISHPAAAAPPARSGTFSAGVLAKVGKPETLPGWVQIRGRKLNSISPQVLLGKHAFSQVSISFSFSVLRWSAFALFKNEIRTERRGPKDDTEKRWKLLAAPGFPSRSPKLWNQQQSLAQLRRLRPERQSRTTQPPGGLGFSLGVFPGEFQPQSTPPSLQRP